MLMLGEIEIGMHLVLAFIQISNHTYIYIYINTTLSFSFLKSHKILMHLPDLQTAHKHKKFYNSSPNLHLHFLLFHYFCKNSINLFHLSPYFQHSISLGQIDTGMNFAFKPCTSERGYHAASKPITCPLCFGKGLELGKALVRGMKTFLNAYKGLSESQ